MRYDITGMRSNDSLICWRSGIIPLLARVKDALAFESQAQYGVEADLPPQVLAEHAVSTRHAHKFMLMQLQVLKFCLDFLDSGLCVENASKSSVRQEVAEAKQEWKKLKAEYQQQVESIQKDVPQLLLKLEQAWNRAQLLEEALQRYQDKKLEMEEKARSAQKRQQKEQDALYEQQRRLEERMAELQGSLQAQREELQQLRRELEEEERQACAWQEEVQRISDFRSLLETLQGVRLLSESKSDLEFELISPAQPGAATPHALKLRLHWRDDGSVMLQSDSPFFPPSLVLPEGTCGNIRAIVLELQNSYFQQAQLLAEIELLHSCFAIDWQQEKRILSYLKPSSTCNLYVEPGYPASGGISLCSVKVQHGTVDATSYKPPQERPSLRDWLEYLSAVDFNAPFLA
nr:ZW10 interactor-like isoform X1 [Podarcis muralis]